jgi:hypothetical protein
VSLTSARLATTTDGVKFTTAAYTAELIEAVRLVSSAASGSGSTAVARTLAAESFSGPFAQALESDRFEVGDVAVLGTETDTHLVEQLLCMEIPAPVVVAVGAVESATPHEFAAAHVSRSLSVVGGDSPVSVGLVDSLNLDEFQTTKKTVQRWNRPVRGVKGVLA